MSTLVDLVKQSTVPPAARIVWGRVATTIANPGDDLYVTIAAFDGHRQQWGPCQWSPANALPSRGDDCVVVFDEAETPTVLILTLPNRIVAGAVAAPAPTDPTQPLYVTVPGLPGKIGPCPWAPREVLPTVGDRALVIFDEDLNPSVLLFTLPPPDIDPPPVSGARLITHDLFQADVPIGAGATDQGSAVTVVVTTSQPYTGDPIKAHFFSPSAGGSGGADMTFLLLRDAVVLGQARESISGGQAQPPVNIVYRDPTPPAGAHTYTLKAFVASGSGGAVHAGPGGSGALLPGFLRTELDT